MYNSLVSIESTTHAPTLSKMYNPISTREIIDFLGSEFNFYVSSANQSKSKVFNQEHCKHAVRLRNDNYKIGDDHVEIVLKNSHNGRSSFYLMLGIYRMVCSNGLVVGETFNNHRIPHIGLTYENLTNAMNQTLEIIPALTQLVTSLKTTKGNHELLFPIVKKCIDLRLKDVKGLIEADYLKAITPRRMADEGYDLWTVLNRTQEAIIKGGIPYKTQVVRKNQQGIEYNATLNKVTRPLKSIDVKLNLNQFVFDQFSNLVVANQ